VSKIIQIATLPEGESNFPALFALDDTGRIWETPIKESGLAWGPLWLPEGVRDQDPVTGLAATDPKATPDASNPQKAKDHEN
jgi:hypothetical protein